MSSTYISLLLIVIGEALSIYAELYCGKLLASPARGSYWIWAGNVGLVTLGAWGLMAGYGIGMSAFRDPWIVPVFSITTILLLEPILVFALYSTTPSWRAVGGFVLGSLGLILVLGGE
jgi:hypothetical protein